MSYKVRQKNVSHLFTVHQKEGENLKDYVKRFNQVVLKMEDRSDKVVIMAMMEELRPRPLLDSFQECSRDPVGTPEQSRQIHRRKRIG